MRCCRAHKTHYGGADDALAAFEPNILQRLADTLALLRCGSFAVYISTVCSLSNIVPEVGTMRVAATCLCATVPWPKG